MKKLYTALRGALVARDLQHTDLARLLLISEGSVSNRFRGLHPWTVEEMYSIMDWLGLPHDQLHIYFPPNGIAVQPAANERRKINETGIYAR